MTALASLALLAAVFSVSVLVLNAPDVAYGLAFLADTATAGLLAVVVLVKETR